MFQSHGASFDFTCMEMLDSEQPAQCECGPFQLVQQVNNIIPFRNNVTK